MAISNFCLFFLFRLGPFTQPIFAKIRYRIAQPHILLDQIHTKWRFYSTKNVPKFLFDCAQSCGLKSNFLYRKSVPFCLCLLFPQRSTEKSTWAAHSVYALRNISSHGIKSQVNPGLTS